MAVISKEEIIKAVRTLIGEEPNDDGIALMENITDTFDDISAKVNTDWQSEKAKLENQIKETDANWRKKYTARFMQGSSNEDKDMNPPEDNPESKAENIDINDLFTTKGE